MPVWAVIIGLAIAENVRQSQQIAAAPPAMPQATPVQYSEPSSSGIVSTAGCVVGSAASGAKAAQYVAIAASQPWYVPLGWVIGGAAGAIYGAATC
tara:strand:+ start:1128 stop:1415 length:288 start_codon:yes stop_codon:yes gene_type:complete